MSEAAPRILAIDDDPMVTLLLEDLLGGTYELTIASSGSEGIATAVASPPDLILLDVVMPDMDGFETCRRLRAVSQLAHTKILLVSGMGRVNERVQGYEAGADDYLTKPFDGAELLAKVRVYLRLKKAEELDRLKTAFVANMSHEIRTPFNAVLGLTELLLETTLTKEQREHLLMVSQSARSLLTIIDDILDWSKIEAGRLAIERVPVDLRHLLSSTARALSVQVGAKDVETVIDLDPQLPAEVIGDPLRLRQVLTNLLANALKFTAQGEVVLRAAVRATRDDEVDVRLSVRDTGIGIDEASQRQLFESFYQADVSTTRRFGGTGLGLAISRRLAQLMGGSLGLRSAVGQGSTFFVDLTMRIVRPAPTPPFSGQRVLLLETHPVAASTTRRMLVDLGLDVTACENLVDALAALEAAAGERRPFSAALVAIGRPGVDVDAVHEALGMAAPGLPLLLSVPHHLLHQRRGTEQAWRQLLRPLIPAEIALELAACVTAQRHEAAPVAIAMPAAQSRRLHVLVAEDNRVNQRVVSGLLQRDGHEAAFAENGSECLQRLATGSFDVVLMDMQMPVLDGLAATMQIRRDEAGTGRHVPIIGLTANAFAEDRDRCLAAGMDAYLAKPFRIDDLRQLLAKVAGDLPPT